MKDRDYDFEENGELAKVLTKALLDSGGMNEFMGLVLPEIGDYFEVDRLSLVDYYEHTDQFVLIHFEGYPPNSRYWLQRRLEEMDVRRSLIRTLPYKSKNNPNLFCVPFYFGDVLEAVLVIESDREIVLSNAAQEGCRLISKVLGLFMSSTRLEVNREQLVDMRDLHHARQIQRNFLPSDYSATSHCEVYGYNSSSNLVGGDYFDYFHDRKDSIQCVLADACGHGMAAALIMSNFRGLLQSEIERHTEFSQLFNTLNQRVHLEEDLVQYLTGVFLHLDKRSGTLQYLNAGHYEPIVIGPQGSFRSLPGGGPPLGMFKDSDYVPGETILEPGDLVLLFTDGLVDIQNPEGDYFGTEGITSTLLKNSNLSLNEITKSVLEEARAFSGTRDFEDDITLFMMKVK